MLPPIWCVPLCRGGKDLFWPINPHCMHTVIIGKSHWREHERAGQVISTVKSGARGMSLHPLLPASSFPSDTVYGLLCFPQWDGLDQLVIKTVTWRHAYRPTPENKNCIETLIPVILSCGSSHSKSAISLCAYNPHVRYFVFSDLFLILSSKGNKVKGTETCMIFRRTLSHVPTAILSSPSTTKSGAGRTFPSNPTGSAKRWEQAEQKPRRQRLTLSLTAVAFGHVWICSSLKQLFVKSCSQGWRMTLWVEGLLSSDLQHPLKKPGVTTLRTPLLGDQRQKNC